MSGIVTGCTKSGEKFQLLVTNVHIPSSGIRKKNTISELMSSFKKFNIKFNKLLLLRDLNMDTLASIRLTLKMGTGFQKAKVSNSKGSRYNKGTVGRMIDHIYYAGLNSRPNWCTANRFLDL
ncbi:hypothetical protein AYI70_g2254 [Smittium culicis]|uniref:Endonuclease/exonuclease/phosphatase domain-containing protein n=1 Tax=Smittium culicis TaxID=133412 RepID=A0A1R1Y9C4_9FUNG|nr:hypothetical protein AYI70_g2254 [Smittium culicis]